ncbi:MAG: SRPBCC family protein [Actinobacteria bacterium]|nr:SRPBCC family protein [Actinomycetota bacterium]
MTDELGTLHGEGDGRAIHFERLYHATLDELWRALTDPASLAGWLAPVRRFELETGGRVHIDFGDGEEMHGVMRELEPYRVVEYTWDWESVVRFELEPRDDGVLLLLDHSALPTEQAPSHGAGWHAHLDLLEAHLRGESIQFAPRYEALLPMYQREVATLP